MAHQDYIQNFVIVGIQESPSLQYYIPVTVLSSLLPDAMATTSEIHGLLYGSRCSKAGSLSTKVTIYKV